MGDGKKGYFEAALSDFVFDVAAGGAIRHLVDRGYSVEQMMKELAYPVPRAKVEKAVNRYMAETGILLAELPWTDGENMHLINEKDGKKLYGLMQVYIEKYSIQNAYAECCFGKWMRKDEKKLQQVMSHLTSREQEYIMGINWEYDIMYHRLTERMREIGYKLAVHTEDEWKFYFGGD